MEVKKDTVFIGAPLGVSFGVNITLSCLLIIFWTSVQIFFFSKLAGRCHLDLLKDGLGIVMLDIFSRSAFVFFWSLALHGAKMQADLSLLMQVLSACDRCWDVTQLFWKRFYSFILNLHRKSLCDQLIWLWAWIKLRVVEMKWTNCNSRKLISLWWNFLLSYVIQEHDVLSWNKNVRWLDTADILCCHLFSKGRPLRNQEVTFEVP